MIIFIRNVEETNDKQNINHIPFLQVFKQLVNYSNLQTTHCPAPTEQYLVKTLHTAQWSKLLLHIP